MDAVPQKPIEAASGGAPRLDQLTIARREICALLDLLRETLDQLEREATVFDGLVLRQGELFKQAGMD